MPTQANENRPQPWWAKLLDKIGLSAFGLRNQRERSNEYPAPMFVKARAGRPRLINRASVNSYLIVRFRTAVGSETETLGVTRNKAHAPRFRLQENLRDAHVETLAQCRTSESALAPRSSNSAERVKPRQWASLAIAFRRPRDASLMPYQRPSPLTHVGFPDRCRDDSMARGDSRHR